MKNRRNKNARQRQEIFGAALLLERAEREARKTDIIFEKGRVSVAEMERKLPKGQVMDYIIALGIGFAL